MATNGLVTPDVAKKLLDFPDLEDELSLDQASSDLVREMIDSMLDGGDYMPPEPYINLEDAQRVAQLSLLRGKLHKVSESNLDKIRTFLADISDMLTMAAAPAPDAAPAGPQSALPNAQTPEVPQIDTMAASMPPMAGMPEAAMGGDMLRGAA
jgi:hypothetical protein